ncbi:MAG TPA: carboxypeptidase regulatory-like domain-containing protein [Terriglobales bacterium]|nr:carboxypeptidase regulatory-like domain-containing protein [Terriglobales bacterium]
MKKLTLLFVFLLSLICATSAWGQITTATVNGTVTDVQGATLAGAEVTVTSPDTGFTRTAASGGAGTYSLPELPPGTYSLRIKAKGFASIEQKKITLLVGQILTLNFSMKPGAVSEVVEVTSETPLIETSSSDVVGSVSPVEVSTLPIIDRNFSGLELLVPGVRQAEGFDPTKSKVGNISVNGGDGRQVDTNVDGGDNKDLVVGGLVQNFTMEGISEFNVMTDHYTAEAGHSVAAVVNVISKSGTNTLHGSLFGLFQNSSLNKNDYFTLKQCAQEDPPVPESSCPKPVFHRYHFGGSVGGPVIKNKFFFFGAVEQKREPGSITVNPASFLDLTSFASQTADYVGGPYAYPVSTLPSPYIDTMATIKLDYKLNDKQNLFLRYGRQKWTVPNDQLGTPFNSDGTQGTTDINNFHDLTLAHNWTVATNKVNTFNFHIQDMVNIIGDAPTNTFTYPLSDGSTIQNPNIAFGDGTNVGINVNVPQETLIRKYQFKDDFNWSHGKHDMKFGANWIYFAKLGGYFYSQYGYTMTFWDNPACIGTGSCPDGTGGVYPEGLQTPGAVHDILLNGGSGSTSQPPWHSLGLYFQDDYKIKPHFTLNLGLRWDANIDFLQSQYGGSLANSNKGIYDLKQVMGSAGFPTEDPGAQRIVEIVGNTGDLQRRTADWREFQPRVGFAWDVTGVGKHVIRGGYGIARDQIFQNITLWSIQQSQPTIYQTVFEATGSAAPGLGCTETGTGPIGACTFAFGVDPLPVPPAATTDLAGGATPRITNPKITDPWSQQMSIGYEWQVTPDYAFSVDYHHILGTHEERVLNMNPVIGTVCDPAFGGDPEDPRCVNGTGTRLMDYAFQTVYDTTGTTPCSFDGVCGAGRFNKIYDYSTNNRSLYDGLNFQLKKRMSKRFMFQTSYVLAWSRSWGGFPVASYGGSGLAITPEQQFQPNEFARTNFDERGRFVFSGVFQLPYGFNLGPIFQAASARPYSFLAGSDLDGDGRVILDRVCVGSTLTDPITTPGCTMIKPNTLSGKPFVEMDMSVDKAFKLGERAKLTLKWEFFNLFNRANFCNSYEESVSAGLPPDGTFNTPQSYCNGPSNAAFGGISGYSAAANASFRNQFGFRFEF